MSDLRLRACHGSGTVWSASLVATCWTFTTTPWGAIYYFCCIGEKMRPEGSRNLHMVTQQESGWARIWTHTSPSNTCALHPHGRLPLHIVDAEKQGGSVTLHWAIWDQEAFLLPISSSFIHPCHDPLPTDLSCGFWSALPPRCFLCFWSTHVSDSLRNDSWFIKSWKLALSMEGLVCSGVACFYWKYTYIFYGCRVVGAKGGSWLDS